MALTPRIKALILIIRGTLAVTVFLASQTGEGMPSSIGAALDIFFSQFTSTLLWMLAAMGAGSWAIPLLNRERLGQCDHELIVTSIGVLTLLWIDSIIGSLGLFSNNGIAWIILVVLGIPAVIRIRSWKIPSPESTFSTWILIAAAVPLGVLLIASLSTPGWLWRTEFAGYDALSYHLQLPREWASRGGIVETPHNAYGYLPNGVEAAFLHLRMISRSPWEFAESCQMLCASWTVLAAITTGRIARKLSSPEIGSVAAALSGVLLLGTPWVIVTGSLAYNESVVLLALAAAILLFCSTTQWTVREAILLGVFTGGACLAKLSSGVLVVLPLAMMCLILLRRGRWIPIAATTAGILIVVLSPWLIRNASWTGNPTFPFLTSFFGTGDWTAQQIMIWNLAHGGDGQASMITQLWNEFLREGIGKPPNPSEPWLPQWSVLPWLGILGGMLALQRTQSEHRRRMVIALLGFIGTAIVCWLLMTHAKARFLLPVAVPLSVLAALGASEYLYRHRLRVLLPIGAWIFALLPMWLYLGEGRSRPAWGIGKGEVMRGNFERELLSNSRDENTLNAVMKQASTGFILNHVVPDSAQILLLGSANPYHLSMGTPEKPRILYSTVWTRGPLEEILAEGGSPQTWITKLRERGITHVLINPGMLGRWSQSGWLAQELSEENIRSLMSALKPAHRFADGSGLFLIPPPIDINAPIELKLESP